MATTKTLTPTNQAITLAAFTEKPDNRTNVTNDDKMADAINTLNSNMATLTYTGTVDSFQTSLVSLASNMSVGEFRNIKYTAGETLSPFRNTRIYGGTFKRTGSNYWSVMLEDPEGLPIYGTYRNGTWGWELLALDNKIVVENVGGDNTEVIPANGVKNIMFDVTKTGYTPVGIVGFTGSGTTGVVLQEYYISANRAAIYLRNVLSSDITPSKLYVRVLYSRN